MSERRRNIGSADDQPDVPLIERAANRLSVPGGESSPRPADLFPPGGKVAALVPEPKIPEEAPLDSEAPEPKDTPTNGARRVSRFCEVDFELLKRYGVLTPNMAQSRTREEFRVIKRSVLQTAFQRPDATIKAPNLVMVTSARPGEGKTFTAMNLAISIALERDYTVLLIDADFTKPSILKHMGIEADKGLIDVLEDPSIDLSDVLIRTNIEKLTVLPAGRAHELSTELLASQRMKDVMDDIAWRYRDRLVLFDSPPVLSTSEPSALAMHVGQVLFVVEANKTPKSTVEQALELIDPGPKVGLVLNRCQGGFGNHHFGSYYKR